MRGLGVRVCGDSTTRSDEHRRPRNCLRAITCAGCIRSINVSHCVHISFTYKEYKYNFLMDLESHALQSASLFDLLALLVGLSSAY